MTGCSGRLLRFPTSPAGVRDLTPQGIFMRTPVLLCISLLLIAGNTGCGNSGSSTVITPPPKTQTTTFAFMQEVAGQNEMFSPMLGTYVTTGSNTQFTASAVLDPTNNNQPITGDFYSIVVSPDGKNATVDLYGGLDRNSAQWDIWVASLDGKTMVQVTNDTNYNRTPQFSPDGNRIIFVSVRPVSEGGLVLPKSSPEKSMVRTINSFRFLRHSPELGLRLTRRTAARLPWNSGEMTPKTTGMTAFG